MDLPGSLVRFFRPGGIAVFGSMMEGWFFGGAVVVKELQALGYGGRIYPIHPSASRVYGLKVYPDLLQVEGVVDMAVIATSYRAVPEILEACGKKGVSAAVVIADGFAEVGPEGIGRQDELVAVAKARGIRIIGPNTLGIYRPQEGISTVPYEKGYHLPPRGGLSIITQTGIYGPQAAALNEYRFGISTIIDLGNMCDIDEVDCLEYLGSDPDTTVIGMYIEHTRRPRKLMEIAAEVSSNKPVICLKGGRSSEAAHAMASHTGSIAGQDVLYDALFRQAGIIRIFEYEDLMLTSKVFLTQPLPRGNRLGIISLTGAMGIQCIDAAVENGLVLGRLTGSSMEKLHAVHHTLAGHPIDLGPATAANGIDFFAYYMRCFEVLMEDENIDCIYLNTYISSYLEAEGYAHVFRHMADNLRKPVVSWSYGPSSESVRRLGAFTESHGIPAYPSTRKAIEALGHLVRYAQRKRQAEDTRTRAMSA
jgi:acyl-CoA synthetase (NDP forming)